MNECSYVDLEHTFRSQSLIPDKIFLKKINDAEIVYVGETHRENSFNFYSYLLQKSKISDQRNCVAIETDFSNSQTTLDECNKNLEEATKINESKNSHLDIFCPGLKEPIGVPGFQKMTIDAFKRGWEVHAIDERFKCSENNVDPDTVACRNLYMAKRIEGLAKAGCSKILVFVGALHLLSDANLKSAGINSLVAHSLKRSQTTIYVFPDKNYDLIKEKLSRCGNGSQEHLLVSGEEQLIPFQSGMGPYGSLNQFDTLVTLPPKNNTR